MGTAFTVRIKKLVRKANVKKYGALTCENCKSAPLPLPKQSQKGVAPDPKQAEIDHIKPRSQGHDGTLENGQVLCRTCNGQKSDN